MHSGGYDLLWQGKVVAYQEQKPHLARGSLRRVSFLCIRYLVHVCAVLVDSQFHCFCLTSAQVAGCRAGETWHDLA